LVASPLVNYTQQERGLSSYQLPGCIQKKIAGPGTGGSTGTVLSFPQAGSSAAHPAFFDPPYEMDQANAAGSSVPGGANPGGGSTILQWTPSLGDAFASAEVTEFSTPSLPAGATVTAIKVVCSYIASEVGGAGYGGEIMAGEGSATTNVLAVSSASGSTTSGSFGSSLSLLPTFVVELFNDGSTNEGIPPGSWGQFASFLCHLEIDYSEGAWPGIAYDRPVTAGNFLVATAVASSGVISSDILTDSLGNTWTPIFSAGLAYQVWYATNGTTGICQVGFPNLDGAECALFEIYGVDALDSVVTSGPVTTSNAQGFFGYLLNIGLGEYGSGPAPRIAPAGWNTALEQANFNSGIVGGDSSPYVVAFDRVTRAGQTIPLASPFSTGSAAFAALSFKATTPNSFPFPLGDFIDKPSFDLTRQQCRAFGLYGSLSMNSQSAASDWLKNLFLAANAAPVYLGNKLFSIPYSEVSTAGNGATYTSPTASGPVAELIADYGQGPYADFMEGGTPQVETADRIELPNVLQLQIICRENNYNQLVIAQPESATLSLYGMRKADPVVMNCVQDAVIARMILGIMVRRQQYGGDVYEFTLAPRWMLLSPMDLITLTDVLASIVGVPVRITSMSEQEDFSMECTAEPFVYGMCAPTPYATSSPTPNGLNTGTSAGDITELIIFEPVPELCSIQNQAQIWCVIGSNAENYGGCQVYVSTDGGASYDPAGDPVMGTATMGVLSAPWAAATSPDTTNNLSLDMTLTAQPISTISPQQETQRVFPCIVTGADLTIENLGTAVAEFSIPVFSNLGTYVASPSLDWNYELMAYAVADLTGMNTYELLAAGGNELLRSVYNAPNTGGVGIAHSAGERFAILNPNNLGIFKINLPSQWVGTPVYFKFLSFNEFGSALQSLSDVPAYSYTPTGVPYS